MNTCMSRRVAGPGSFISPVTIGAWLFQRHGKSAAHFFPHPRTGLPLYRTGDLGAYAPDGSIVFRGRADSQVKINGFRVEIGEITLALKTHSGVEDAHVLAVGAGRHPRLAAFVKTGPIPPLPCTISAVIWLSAPLHGSGALAGGDRVAVDAEWQTRSQGIGRKLAGAARGWHFGRAANIGRKLCCQPNG